MFERFTDPGRRSLVLAQEEARLNGDNFIGTEHLLLGVLGLDRGEAVAVLHEHGLDAESVRHDIARAETTDPATGSPPFTPEAKRMLEFALREALQLGHHHIGPGHLVLGLIRQGRGQGPEIMARRAGPLEDMRDDLIHRMAEEQPEDGPIAEPVRPVTGPTCRRCRGDLVGHLRYKQASAADDDGGTDHHLAFVYCGRCGDVVALAPDDASR